MPNFKPYRLKDLDPPRRERLRRSIVTLRLLSNYFQLLQNLWTTLLQPQSAANAFHNFHHHLRRDFESKILMDLFAHGLHHENRTTRLQHQSGKSAVFDWDVE